MILNLKLRYTSEDAMKKEDNNILLEHGINEEDRTVYIDYDIDEVSASRILKAFAMFGRNPNNDPVTIIISSNGGDIYSGLAIIDAMQELKNKKIKVITKAYGSAMSMAAWILAAGSKRYASKNSFIMVHEGWYETWGKWHDVKIDMKHSEVLEEKCWRLLEEYTGTKIAKWKKMCIRGDYYMGVDEAKELGIIDHIID